MSRATRRLLAQSPLRALVSSTPAKSILRCTHGLPFSNTTKRADKKDANQKPPNYTSGSLFQTSNSQATANPSTRLFNEASSQRSGLSEIAAIFQKNESQRAPYSPDPFLDVSRVDSVGATPALKDDRFEEPHHFHVYATKHNTHITLTRPNRDPIISVSAGNIGFRKSARKHYDSAFQLAGFVMGRMQDRGIDAQIERLEVILRGFGAGREAVTKALLGNEGKRIRHKVVKVSDATRLKFGGTRSKKPRRLG